MLRPTLCGNTLQLLPCFYSPFAMPFFLLQPLGHNTLIEMYTISRLRHKSIKWSNVPTQMWQIQILHWPRGRCSPQLTCPAACVHKWASSPCTPPLSPPSQAWSCAPAKSLSSLTGGGPDSGENTWQTDQPVYIRPHWNKKKKKKRGCGSAWILVCGHST